MGQSSSTGANKENIDNLVANHTIHPNSTEKASLSDCLSRDTAVLSDIPQTPGTQPVTKKSPERRRDHQDSTPDLPYKASESFIPPISIKDVAVPTSVEPVEKENSARKQQLPKRLSNSAKSHTANRPAPIPNRSAAQPIMNAENKTQPPPLAGKVAGAAVPLSKRRKNEAVIAAVKAQQEKMALAEKKKLEAEAQRKAVLSKAKANGGKKQNGSDQPKASTLEASAAAKSESAPPPDQNHQVQLPQQPNSASVAPTKSQVEQRQSSQPQPPNNSKSEITAKPNPQRNGLPRNSQSAVAHSSKPANPLNTLSSSIPPATSMPSMNGVVLSQPISKESPKASPEPKQPISFVNLAAQSEPKGNAFQPVPSPNSTLNPALFPFPTNVSPNTPMLNQFNKPIRMPRRKQSSSIPLSVGEANGQSYAALGLSGFSFAGKTADPTAPSNGTPQVMFSGGSGAVGSGSESDSSDDCHSTDNYSGGVKGANGSIGCGDGASTYGTGAHSTGLSPVKKKTASMMAKKKKRVTADRIQINAPMNPFVYPPPISSSLETPSPPRSCIFSSGTPIVTSAFPMIGTFGSPSSSGFMYGNGTLRPPPLLSPSIGDCSSGPPELETIPSPTKATSVPVFSGFEASSIGLASASAPKSVFAPNLLTRGTISEPSQTTQGSGGAKPQNGGLANGSKPEVSNGFPLQISEGSKSKPTEIGGEAIEIAGGKPSAAYQSPLFKGLGAVDASDAAVAQSAMVFLRHMPSVTVESCLLPDPSEEDPINYDKVNFTLKDVPGMLDDNELDEMMKLQPEPPMQPNTTGRPIAAPSSSSLSQRMLAAGPPNQHGKSNLAARQRLDRLSQELGSNHHPRHNGHNATSLLPPHGNPRAQAAPAAVATTGKPASGPPNTNQPRPGPAETDNRRAKAVHPSPASTSPPPLSPKSQKLLDAVDSVSEPLVISSRRRRSRYAEFLRREVATSGALGWGRAGVGAPGTGSEFSCFFCEYEHLFGRRVWRRRSSLASSAGLPAESTTTTTAPAAANAIPPPNSAPTAAAPESAVASSQPAPNPGKQSPPLPNGQGPKQSAPTPHLVSSKQAGQNSAVPNNSKQQQQQQQPGKRK
ncbi:hypothetical protein HDU97_001834 [Phlyctochytrium planicorne]|nr:hypothetical protein HDU97_001834 [Phlyctochytrium planicorne]